MPVGSHDCTITLAHTAMRTVDVATCCLAGACPEPHLLDYSSSCCCCKTSASSASPSTSAAALRDASSCSAFTCGVHAQGRLATHTSMVLHVWGMTRTLSSNAGSTHTALQTTWRLPAGVPQSSSWQTTAQYLLPRQLPGPMSLTFPETCAQLSWFVSYKTKGCEHSV